MLSKLNSFSSVPHTYKPHIRSRETRAPAKASPATVRRSAAATTVGINFTKTATNRRSNFLFLDLCNSHGDRSTGDKVRGALDFIESGK